MSAATRQARSALASIRREGELVTLTPAVGAAVTLPCLIVRRAEPILRGGQLTFHEEHSTGHIPRIARETEPLTGDVITTAGGDRYRIDAPADRQDGAWVVILRALERLPEPEPEPEVEPEPEP